MVADISISNSSPQLFLDVLPARTRKAFFELSKLDLFVGSRWYLAGGTALALQVGHRQSVDLDFFTTANSFQIDKLEGRLLATKKWITTRRSPGTLYGEFLGAKVSFIVYPFFTPSKSILRYGKIKVLKPHDIAAMKIVAISQRGRKRDFFDLYWYCQNREPLDKVIERTTKQYPYQDHNITHFFNSLTYFADAETDPTPKIFFRANWKEIKGFFQKEARRITKKFIGLRE